MLSHSGSYTLDSFVVLSKTDNHTDTGAYHVPSWLVSYLIASLPVALYFLFKLRQARSRVRFRIRD